MASEGMMQYQGFWVSAEATERRPMECPRTGL